MTLDFPKRIAVIGVTGAGKSTFARILQAKTNLPLVHTDSFLWENGWQHPKTNDELLAYVDHVLDQSTWIIEGYLGYTSPAPDTRLQRADLVIVLDYHRVRLAWHVLKRHVIYHKRHRPELPPACVETFRWRLVRKLWNYLFVRELRNNLDSWTRHVLPEKIIRFKSPKQAQQWLEKIN